ncbi:[protein-PII] uridylyltransferase family protein [Janibacter hoylei]|uniref:[protein-PII] uridylyltransferase family protein n=1 Tax=Janibacter hoylei TaxID=364298 RepID=UPI00389B387D
MRPEGRSGPLTRTLASHRGYYERWAKTWEFQALLKARPVAGDLALGIEWTDMAAEFVWTAAERDGFVADVQAMRRRVLEHIPAKEARRQLKLGSGGLRDVEFAVQLMQLVHGRADRSLRVSSTLGALAALTAGGYVGREDGEALRQAYAFLRTLEHRAVPVNGDHLAPGLLRADPATGHEHELTFHRGRAEELRAVYEDAVRCSPPVAGILQVRVVPRGGVEWLALEAQGVEIDHALDGDRAGGLKDDAGQVVGIGGRLQAGHGRLGDPDAHRDSSQVCASRACSASAYGASSPSQPQAWRVRAAGETFAPPVVGATDQHGSYRLPELVVEVARCPVEEYVGGDDQAAGADRLRHAQPGVLVDAASPFEDGVPHLFHEHPLDAA